MRLNPKKQLLRGQRGKMGPRALCLGTEKGNNLLGPALAWPGRGTWVLKTGGFGNGSATHSYGSTTGWKADPNAPMCLCAGKTLCCPEVTW